MEVKRRASEKEKKREGEREKEREKKRTHPDWQQPRKLQLEMQF